MDFQIENNDKIFDGVRQLLTKIEARIGTHFLGVIYNPEKEGIRAAELCPDGKDDAWCLLSVLEHAKMNKCTVVLHGQGGDFKSGIRLAYSLRIGLQNFSVMVPSLCCSALCFPILKADQLTIFEGAKITQIDPIFEFGEQSLRAIDELKHPDEERRRTAKRILAYCREHIMNLIKDPPSLYNHRKEQYEAAFDTAQITDSFMCKTDHWQEITFPELVKLNLKVKKEDDIELKSLLKKFVEACQEIMLIQDRRVTFACSKKYSFVSGCEGNFLLL